VEHEASTSKIGEDQLFYFQSRGVEAEAAVGMIISGFCREVRRGGQGRRGRRGS
jgi:Fe-S cluster assembly protein SufB